MNKMIVVSILVVMVAGMLTAAAPMTSVFPDPSPVKYLSGALGWNPTNVCGVSDFVKYSDNSQIFLTGNFKPTHGTFQGCLIKASGFYYNAGTCTYFYIKSYSLACPTLTLNSSGH